MQGVEPKFRSIFKGVDSLNLKALIQRYVRISLLRWLEFRGKKATRCFDDASGRGSSRTTYHVPVAGTHHIILNL